MTIKTLIKRAIIGLLFCFSLCPMAHANDIADLMKHTTTLEKLSFKLSEKNTKVEVRTAVNTYEGDVVSATKELLVLRVRKRSVRQTVFIPYVKIQSIIMDGAD